MNIRYLTTTHPSAKVERWTFEGHPWSGRDVYGYGRKIPIGYGVRLYGRRYRVYTARRPHASSLYIRTKRDGILYLRHVVDTTGGEE